jgi:hypothetical protein
VKQSDDELLKLVWNYMEIQSPVAQADAIIVAGSDSGAAAYAAELYALNFAPVIVCSGRALPGMDQTEADLLARTLRDCGVPDAAILREQTARNPGESIHLSEILLTEHSVTPKSVILVHCPFSSRSFLATAEAQWSDLRPTFITRHEAIGLTEYSLRYGRGETIRRTLGEFQRLRSYAKKGYQSPQLIPDDVQEAYDTLIRRGHHTH